MSLERIYSRVQRERMPRLEEITCPYEGNGELGTMILCGQYAFTVIGVPGQYSQIRLFYEGRHVHTFQLLDDGDDEYIISPVTLDGPNVLIYGDVVDAVLNNVYVADDPRDAALVYYGEDEAFDLKVFVDGTLGIK